MQVLEDKAQWVAQTWQPWLEHVERTGTIDWKLYRPPRNSETPGTRAVDLAESSLMLISSAGAYLRDSQTPFDPKTKVGDYSIRTFPSMVAFDDLEYSHGHYDENIVRADPQVALPLRHLRQRVADGRLGSLTPSVVSFVGYLPDVAAIADVMAPDIVRLAQTENASAALLAPV